MSVILITFAGAPKVSEKAISKVFMILAILTCIHLPKIQMEAHLATEQQEAQLKVFNSLWMKSSGCSFPSCTAFNTAICHECSTKIKLRSARCCIWLVTSSPSLLQALSTLWEFGKVYPATCLAAGPTVRQWPYLHQNVLVQPLLSSLTAETVRNPSSDLFGTHLWHSCFHPCSQPAMPCALAQGNQHL